MNYLLLVAELRDDPRARGYAGMSDAQAADDLNAPRVPVWVPGSNVTTAGLLAAFADPADAEAFLQGVEAAAGANPLVARALKLLSPAEGGLDVAHPSTRAVLDALTLAGAVTSQAAATVKALGQRLVSRGEELGLGDPVGDGHVKSARLLIGGG